MDSITASGRQDERLLQRINDAAAQLERAEAEARLARDRRDTAVRAGRQAGLRLADIGTAAGISPGMVSRLINAPR